MRFSSSAQQLSSLLLVTLFLITTATAQKQQPPAPAPQKSAVQTQPNNRPEEETTFDLLLAARSYKLYGEVRMIGQLARSSGVRELLEPARLLGAPPPEVKGIIEFLNANADLLATSRVMFAAIPARPTLPQTFVAIELASPQDAIKLEPKLRNLLSTMSKTSASPAPSGNVKPQLNPKQQPQQAKPTQPAFIKRAGSLILTSDTSFTLKSLRPDGSQPLSADPNFQRMRSRFASEALFLYYDVNLAEYVTKPRVTVEVSAPVPPPQARTNNKSSVQADESIRPAQPTQPQVIAPENSPPSIVVTDPTGAPQPPEEMPPAPVETEPVAQGSQRGADSLTSILPMLGMVFGGAPSWPEAVGLAAALEGDEVIVRAVLVNAPGAPNAVIPFIPALVAGPEIAPQASSLSPAETDIFISTSLDFPRIYDAFLKTMMGSQRPDENGPLPAQEAAGGASFETQIAAFELLLGFKIKEDLLPALGNEVAVNVPFSWLNRGPNSGIQTSREAAAAAQSSQPGFVLFISLNDKERVREMLPRVLEVLDLKAPGAPGQIERRDGIEITSYGQVSVAIIDNFLAISPDTAALRSVVDAHENNQTLATNPDFKNSTAWQSNRMLGQVYLSSAFTTMQEPFVQLDDKLQDFLARFAPKPSPISFEALNDGTGFFHELHLPQDWVALVMAGLTADTKLSTVTDNELRAVSALTVIREAQRSYKEGKGKGSFATRDQLVSENLAPKELLEMDGYRIEITVTGEKFEATATPSEYGKTGRQSFYLDESGIIRGADHGGQPATVADKPL